jgi:amino acid adenylation domain-containing protein
MSVATKAATDKSPTSQTRADRPFTEYRGGGGAPSLPRVHEMFEECARARPNATAVVHPNERLTYGQLDRRANQLARYLRKTKVGPGSLVGIYMNRSVDLVVSILGVLKAGAAYVPLDPTYPRLRLEAMFEDVDMDVVLTQPKLTSVLPFLSSRVVCPETIRAELADESDAPVAVERTDDDLAYVVFTSGSTGRPKAAAVSHAGWSNLMNWFRNEFCIDELDRTLLISAFGFDITQRSIAMPLVSGGELDLLETDVFDPIAVRAAILHRRITLLNCAPSMFYTLIEDAGEQAMSVLDRLRILFLGGEPISRSRLRLWMSRDSCKTVVANVYGVAECTDVSSFYCLTDHASADNEPVPIGKPISNTTIYLLDEDMTPVVGGGVGEICVAGVGVGKGYLNDPELSQAKFVKDPFGRDPEALLYKTGDLGRLSREGNLEYVGRTDNQVKISGIRIDLGDIETVIRSLSAVREAVVVEKQVDGVSKHLVAYVVLESTTSSAGVINAIRSAVKLALPRYMVPARFVLLSAMPLNPNDKIDRKKLRDMCD